MSNPTLIKQTFVSYHSDLLCTTLANRHRVNMNIINVGPIHSVNRGDSLDLAFSAEDIKKATWSIDDDKAPGLDGYLLTYIRRPIRIYALIVI